MTEELKQKFEKRFEKWLRKYLLCNDCKKKCTCIQLNAYCEEQVKQAYIAGATEVTKELQEQNEYLNNLVKEKEQRGLEIQEDLLKEIEELRAENHQLGNLVAKYMQGEEE